MSLQQFLEVATLATVTVGMALIFTIQVASYIQIVLVDGINAADAVRAGTLAVAAGGSLAVLLPTLTKSVTQSRRPRSVLRQVVHRLLRRGRGPT